MSISFFRAAAGNEVVQRSDVVDIYWNLRNLRNQLEKLKGEVDQPLAIANEGLNSIGLEGSRPIPC
jgi:hypothetical protein